MNNTKMDVFTQADKLRSHYLSLSFSVREKAYLGISSTLDEESELDCLDHFYEANGCKDYAEYADLCELLHKDGIIDIGCACGHQSSILIDRKLKYHGINDWTAPFWGVGEIGVTYQIGHYPCNVECDTASMLAVSRLCVGYFNADKESLCNHLFQDFSSLIVDTTPETQNELKKNYPYFVRLSSRTMLYTKEPFNLSALLFRCQMVRVH